MGILPSRSHNDSQFATFPQKRSQHIVVMAVLIAGFDFAQAARMMLQEQIAMVEAPIQISIS